MPGPQSFTPKSVRPSRPKRRFTVAQANSTLPLVQRVVRDIVRTHGEVARLQAELETPPVGKPQPDVQSRLDALVGQMEDYVDELTEIGCDLKDYQTGLIDFVGRHAGHDVCLCWKLGEPRIDFWHEMDAGFSGRQSVSTLREEQ